VHFVRAIASGVWGLAAIALVGLVPRVAAGQSYHAFHAVLAVGTTYAGSIDGAPIEVLGWDAPERPRVRFSDPSIVITSAVALEDPSTRVVVGVGRRARLETGSVWAAWMVAGAWAPLRRSRPSGPEISVVEGLPFASAVIVESVPAARFVPERAFHVRARSRHGWRTLCGPDDTGVVAHAAPSSDAPRWEVPLDAQFRCRGVTHGWTTYDVRVGGFEIRAFVERELALCRGAEPVGVLQALTVPWCPAVSTLDGLVVPAATELYAPGTSAPLGRTRRDLVARRVDERVVELRGGRMSRWILRAEIGTGA